MNSVKRCIGVDRSFAVNFIPKPCKTENTADSVQLVLSFSIRESVMMPTSTRRRSQLVLFVVRCALLSSISESSMCAVWAIYIDFLKQKPRLIRGFLVCVAMM